jgi:hypothetical protein
MRSKKDFVLVFASLAAAAVVIGYLLGHDFSECTTLWDTLREAASWLANAKNSSDLKTSVTSQDVALLAPQIIAGAAVIVSLYKGLKAFKIDPAVLLSRAAESFKLRDAKLQTSFRTRFAEQFEEVTSALPYTMVIVIDDLDRCQPETILIIMEAVNFLVSSGKCFVLFGMATHRVEAALAVAFEKVASEMVGLDAQSLENAPQELKERVERQRRLSYARDYLEKIINLGVVVPRRNDIPPNLLVESTIVQTPNYFAAALGEMLQFWPLWLAMATIAFGFMLGIEYTIPKSPPSSATIQKAPAQVPPPMTPVTDEGSTVKTAPVTSNRYVPTIQENNRLIVDKWVVSITIAFVIAIVAGLVLYRLRSASYEVHDSRKFHDALRIWMPAVQSRRGTPRAIKRFGNRLRYLAMLQQDNKADETGYDELRRWLKSHINLSKRQVRAGGRDFLGGNGIVDKPIRETVLVALATLHEVYGPEWRSRLHPIGSDNVDGAVNNAIKNYTATTNTNWPPGDHDLNAFEQLLNGVRFLGQLSSDVTGS